MKSRIDDFLITKELKNFVQKVDIQTSIAPDHKTICLSLKWPKVTPRGPGFWKFSNTLLEDEDNINKVRDIYPQLREKYEDVQDKRIFWELLKMEIRSITIAFTKAKSKLTNKRELEVKQQLDILNAKICDSSDLYNIDLELKQYDDLRKELQTLYERKGKAAMFRSKCRWNVQPNTFSILRREIITRI